MESVERRAPKNGYDNDKKSKYRHNVWKHLSKKVIPVLNENDNAKVLMLPSKEGIEIDVAIKFGIKPEQIIAIDENPALLAHAKWKCKIPKENRFGCKVSKVGHKIKEKGWVLAGANLDFCNKVSEELVNELNTFLDVCPIYNKFSFFCTFMKGRESKALYLLLKKRNSPTIFDHDRLGALYELINLPEIYNHYWACDFEETYISNKSPMVYACFSSINGEVTSNEIKEKIERLEVLGERAHNIDNCKTGRNGKYRNKSKKVHRIEDKIRKDINEIRRQIISIKQDYAFNKGVIEMEKFVKDHEPKVYLHWDPHYRGFQWSRPSK